MSQSDFIKSMLNIKDDNISFPGEEYYQVIQKGNHLVKIFKGFLKSSYSSCPHCNSKNIVNNGSRKRNIKYGLFQNYNVELDLSIQRYLCKDCRKTFSSSTNIVEDNSEISLNLKSTIVLELKKNLSLNSIAKKYNTSISSVKRIMLEHFPEYKNK